MGGRAVLSPQAFIAVLAEVAECDPADLSLSTPLDHVVLDSFAALELYVALEDQTGITVEWEPRMVTTIGDLYQLYVGLAAERTVTPDA